MSVERPGLSMASKTLVHLYVNPPLQVSSHYHKLTEKWELDHGQMTFTLVRGINVHSQVRTANDIRSDGGSGICRLLTLIGPNRYSLTQLTLYETGFIRFHPGSRCFHIAL